MTIAYYLVTGRICGDDEDTALTFESDCDDIDEVIRIFVASMKDSYIEAASESGEEVDPDVEVFVNYVYCSDRPILPAYGRFGS